MALQYHAAQIEVQEEANTRPVAEMLAHWVGPVEEFAAGADLIVLASGNSEGRLQFVAASGQAPIVDAGEPSEVRLPDLEPSFGASGALVGGLAISLSQRRRVRLNGSLSREKGACLLKTSETFVNCRKYIAPSIALENRRHVGPSASNRVALDDPWLADMLGRAETAFLASMAPDGQPDVSHRGGSPGFLQLTPDRSCLVWPEFVGDGMMKTAGNVRGTATATLLILDLESGDAAELRGKATYRTLRTAKEARMDALEQHRDPFPVQGEMNLVIEEAWRLSGMVLPRRRIEKVEKLTSCSPIDDQYPQ